MSLVQRLIEHPQREKGGVVAQERFDYQALWGLALILSCHEDEHDYAIAFEFHEDVVFLDSATAPASIRFYQVKTKERGHWTLTDLYRRPPLKKGQIEADRPNSFIGKLFSNCIAFPDETTEMAFVSNAPLQFAEANQSISFKDCDSAIFTDFLKRLKAEHPSALDQQASLLKYIKADLSLDDAATHAKGKLHNFVTKSLGEITYNLDSLYRAVVEDCRTRSKYTGAITSFEDLIRFKSITQVDVQGWLAGLRAYSKMPDWQEFADQLIFDDMQKMRMRAEWLRYRVKVLDSADESIRLIRRDIMFHLLPVVEGVPSFMQAINIILPLVKPSAIRHLTPYSDDRLRVMILYEVIHHATTG